jgi:Threonine dehydratase
MELSKEDLVAAHDRTRAYIHRTPVLTSRYLDELAGGNIYFKCENFQKIGAFKIRGAMNAVLSLSKDKLEKGVATHSSGNHAQALAYAAREVGTRAFIVMPENSARVKVDAVKGYGAEINFCQPTLQAREEGLQAVIEKTGATLIHPFDDLKIIAGQSGVAKELIEDVPGLNNIIAPVGGGGLLSGTLLAVKHFSPKTKVYAAEPEGAADAVLSLRTGKIESAPYVDTIADGLRTNLGEKTFPIIQKLVEKIYTVSDKEIVDAMRLVYERLKIVIEPSSATTLALVLKHKEEFKNQKTGVIFSGGNVDLTDLARLFRNY